ncbi:MAG: ATPase, T2SS/T4P/T4SS family [Oscillospiraceae bacterium]
MNEKTKLESIYPLLTPKILGAVRFIPEFERMQIQEIRLRIFKKLTVTMFGREYFVTEEGNLTRNYAEGVDIIREDIDYAYQRAFRCSLHSFPREIAEGYITYDGGNRVGFCGTAVLGRDTERRVENVKYISSVNIRIARECIGCGDEIYNKAFAKGESSLIIAGPPSSGKTTILRDICLSLGQKVRIALIDERNEIAAVSEGVPQNSVGMLTDVFSSYSKYDGIMTAVRVMSPQVLVCDEIGAKEDSKALEYAVNSGVRLIVTAHAENYDDLKHRPVISKLMKDKVFNYCAILGTGPLCGKLTGFYKLREEQC